MNKDILVYFFITVVMGNFLSFFLINVGISRPREEHGYICSYIYTYIYMIRTVQLYTCYSPASVESQTLEMTEGSLNIV
jgi:hypothetical protein